jgi:hypothetical protein
MLGAPSAEEEEQSTKADWDYFWTLFRGQLNSIQDERLQVLLRRRRAASWIAGTLMVACLVSMAFG